LLAAARRPNEVIAKEVGCSKPSVLKWRERFTEAGVDGLEEAGGRGRNPTYDRGFVENVVSVTLSKPPKCSTHWSTRTLADKLGVSN
jgi:transposase